MPKKQVRFNSVVYLREGDSAFVYPVDHPSPLVSNTKMVITSPVVAVRTDGSFETQNTVYIPQTEKARAETQSYLN